MVVVILKLAAARMRVRYAKAYLVAFMHADGSLSKISEVGGTDFMLTSTGHSHPVPPTPQAASHKPTSITQTCQRSHKPVRQLNLSMTLLYFSLTPPNARLQTNKDGPSTQPRAPHTKSCYFDYGESCIFGDLGERLRHSTLGLEALRARG